MKMIFALLLVSCFGAHAATELTKEQLLDLFHANASTLDQLSPGMAKDVSGLGKSTQCDSEDEGEISTQKECITCLYDTSEKSSIVAIFGQQYYKFQSYSGALRPGQDSKCDPEWKKKRANSKQSEDINLFLNNKKSMKDMTIDDLKYITSASLEGNIVTLTVNLEDKKSSGNKEYIITSKYDLNLPVFYNPVSVTSSWDAYEATTTKLPNIDPTKLPLDEIEVCAEIPMGITRNDTDEICEEEKDMSDIVK